MFYSEQFGINLNLINRSFIKSRMILYTTISATCIQLKIHGFFSKRRALTSHFGLILASYLLISTYVKTILRSIIFPDSLFLYRYFVCD